MPVLIPHTPIIQQQSLHQIRVTVVTKPLSSPRIVFPKSQFMPHQLQASADTQQIRTIKYDKSTAVSVCKVKTVNSEVLISRTSVL